ncbi:MAG: VacB/RNase II family 3'-5' exoribonuclease [Pseudomonadota bacterium]
MVRRRDVQRVQVQLDRWPSGQELDLVALRRALGPPALSIPRIREALQHLHKRSGPRPPQPPPRQEILVEGVVTRRARGHGRLRLDDDRSLHVAASELGSVVDGDRVRARVEPDRRGREQACGLVVLQRAREQLVGTLRRSGGLAFVEAEDGRFGQPVWLSEPTEAATGTLVEVTLEPGAQASLRGRVLRVIGQTGSSRAEVERILINRGVHREHPPACEAEAATLTEAVPARQLQGRDDLRGLPLVTIDGDDACDFDDAVALEEQGDRRTLTVAIADVASFVTSGSAIDQEARRRATSVYWPGGVAHMLPERLAAQLCSLRPDEDRLAMVCRLTYDGSLEVVEVELLRAVIRSRARLTYDQVNAALDGDAAVRGQLGERWPMVQQLARLAQQLEKRAHQQGRLDLDIPEARFVLDEAGEPIDGFPRPMAAAERLIEVFMVEANRAVARWFMARELPALYRVHPAPRSDRLRPFADAAKALVGLTVDDTVRGQALTRALKAARSDADRRLLSMLLLRGLPQARYDVAPLGHYGLAVSDYLHFTSPIRRYPDLLVHRVLGDDLSGARDPRRRQAEVATAQDPINSAERQAMELERFIDGMLGAQLASRHLGEVFDANLIGLQPGGLFVQVQHPLLEGYLPIEALQPRDRYQASDDGLALVGRRSRRRFRLGDALRVRVVHVDVATRSIELAMPDDGVPAPAPPRHGRRQRRA